MTTEERPGDSVRAVSRTGKRKNGRGPAAQLGGVNSGAMTAAAFVVIDRRNPNTG